MLLKEISYQHGGESLPESKLTIQPDLVDHLCHSGLLRLVETGNNALCKSCYVLCRPMYEITLYDILSVTGGDLHLSVGSPYDFSRQYGLAGQRLAVLESLIYHFLSEIPIVEVILPGISNQENIDPGLIQREGE